MKHGVMIAYVNEMVTRYAPGVRVRSKRDSRLMRFFGAVVSIGNRLSGQTSDFWRRAITFNDIFVPDDLRDNSAEWWPTVLHELRHAVQQRAWWGGAWTWSLAYAFPQSLAVLALGAVAAIGAIWGGPLWLLNLLWLVAPTALWRWRAPARLRWETEAFALTLEAARLCGQDVGRLRARIVEQLSGAAYYYCCTPEEADRMLDAAFADAAGVSARMRDDLLAYAEVARAA